MLSQQCQRRNKTIIPKLLDDHGALLHGNKELVDLSTAENRLMVPELLAQFNDKLAALSWSEQDLAYAEGVGGCPQLRQLMADFVNENFNPRQKVEKSHIVLGAGGCFALTALVSELCDPGDGILIAVPYWPGLDLAIAVRNQAKVVPVQIPFDKFYQADSIRAYEDTLANCTIPVKAILVCNPHNPMGGNYPRETLQATLDFCARNNLHFISDEVYALSQHTKKFESEIPFVSALSLDTSNACGLVHVLYSLSKDFACNGVRMGAFISQENRDVVMSGALSTFCQTSSMATVISRHVILTKENINYVKTTGRELLTAAYDSIKTFLDANKIQYMPANTGMYVFAKLCPADDMASDVRFRSIVKKNSLVISAGMDYHLSVPGWFRVCYACEPAKLKEGLARIAICIKEFNEQEPTNGKLNGLYISDK